jgi:hypothetical protein
VYPHRIRLRGPWDCEPLAQTAGAGSSFGTGPLPDCFRVTMPGRWRDGGLAGFGGRVLFRRRFGYPGRLDATERVWLTFAGVAGAAEVTLNDRFLGKRTGAFDFEVTSLLAARNELKVIVESPTDDGGLWGEVAMEVRRAAFLSPIHLRAEVRRERVTLHVSGKVVGFSERPLDLYVLVDGATLVYTAIEASAEGKPFHLIARELEIGPDEDKHHEVRVELIDGGTVWYRIEQPFAFS